MFKDAQKELRRLEEELLAQEEEEELEEEEEFDEDLEEDDPDDFSQFDQDTWEQPHATLVFRSGAEKFRQQLAAQDDSRVYNADPRDMEPEDLEEEEAPSGGSLRGLVIFAVLLALTVVGMVSWYLLYLRG